MSTLREKITFTCTALAYFLFHLRLGPDAGAIIRGTIAQILGTAPYSIGFTYIIIIIIRYRLDGRWPPWDRILRIFFTLGLFFALFFALYEMGDRAEQEREKQGKDGVSVSLIFHDDSRKEPLCWA